MKNKHGGDEGGGKNKRKGKQQKKSQGAKGSAAGRNSSKCAEYMSAAHQLEVKKHKLLRIFKSNGADFARKWAEQNGVLKIFEELGLADKAAERQERYDIKESIRRAIRSRNLPVAIELAKDHGMVTVIEAMSIATTKKGKLSKAAQTAQQALVAIKAG